MPLRLLFRQWPHRCHSVFCSWANLLTGGCNQCWPRHYHFAHKEDVHTDSHMQVSSLLSQCGVYSCSVWQSVPNAFCRWCARACLCVQALMKSQFFTFLHAELLWLPSRCQCVKSANERQREEGGRKKRWQNINCLLANHPHITRRLSLYLPHYLCLFLTFSYTCI